MSFSHEYNLPMFVGTGGVLTTGKTSDLSKFQIGIFKAKDYSVATGTLTPMTPLIVAAGTTHSKDKLGDFIGGLTQSDKSVEFLLKDILAFERSRPRKAQAEQWVIGWDGVDDNTQFAFKCDTEYRFKIKVWGEDVYGTYTRAVEREVGFKTKCCTSTDCAAGDCNDGVGQKQYADLLRDLINRAPELKFFIKAQTISSDYATTTATHRIYNLTVTDDGSVVALSAVQAIYPSKGVQRVNRVGLISTYQMCDLITNGAPSSFTPSTDISLTDCSGACPSGYTLTSAREVFVIARPLAGSETLITSGNQQTFADSVATEYFPVKTFDGVTGVTAGTDTLTITAHGFVANQAVTYSNGGFTTIPGLTNATVYYIKTVVDANNVRLSATPGGTQIDITGTGGAGNHSLTSTRTVNFLSMDGAKAYIEVVVDTLVADPTALKADIVSKSRIIEAVCTPAAASAIAWVADPVDRYKSKRTLCLTLQKPCGSTGNRLTDLQTYYANETTYVASTLAVRTAGTCNDIYEIQQWSEDCALDGCLTKPVPTFRNLQAFEGFTFSDCPATPGAEDLTTKSGVVLTAAYEQTQFHGCSFSPVDYYQVRPLHIEITQIDESGKPCNTQFKSRKIQYGLMPTQGGRFIMNSYLQASRYKVHQDFYLDPRLRDVLDSNALEIIDTKKTYVTYHLKIKQNREYQNHIADYSPEIYEFVFAFPEGTNVSTFEKYVENITSQNGVYLQDR